MEKIKVLIVDDSAVIRQLVKEILESDPGIEVVGVASDPIFAEKKLEKLKPDVITLDVEMPRMDGISFLKKLMKTNPVPVVMVSAHTDHHAAETIRALELGAVDFITKPKMNIAEGIEALREEIVTKVKAAARAKIRNKNTARPSDGEIHLAVSPAYSVDEVVSKGRIRAAEPKDKMDSVIVLGASTGGTVAISDLLQLMPVDSPGIVIVQHMPEKFTKAYADRINGIVDLTVKEAEDGDRVKMGLVLIAPGGKHMLLQRDKKGFYVQIKDGPPVNRHKPSVDVLFRSAANSVGKRAIGIILTGMGADGAKGMLELKEAGAFNIAQDEDSCVVFGMPKAAIEIGAVDKVAPIETMPALILGHAAGYRKPA
ncbi:MAG: chemotaxis response regulator protein-glutamate methylesterase [Firmicutes bacterium]|nr:chemotaxis response regulator protein-glutamate methylesterase [Bacillota bacterium]